MALFSGKILSAKFIDNSNTIIEVLYNENNETLSYILSVDFTQDDFKELIEEFSLEDIEKFTKENRFNEIKAINDSINNEINRRLESTSENKSHYNEILGSDLCNLLNKKNDDNDFIFSVKISILEDTRVLNSKDKSLKMNIRKSKTLMELLNIYTSLDVN